MQRGAHGINVALFCRLATELFRRHISMFADNCAGFSFILVFGHVKIDKLERPVFCMIRLSGVKSRCITSRSCKKLSI